MPATYILNKNKEIIYHFIDDEKLIDATFEEVYKKRGITILTYKTFLTYRDSLP